MASSTEPNAWAAFSGQSAPEAAAQARSCGQPSRGFTRRRSARPKLAITRAAAPMFSPSCGAFRIMTGVADEASPMTRLQSLGRPSASLAPKDPLRRGLLLGAASLGLAGCGRDPPLTASRTPQLKMDALNAQVAALAKRALPGVLGVGLMNLESSEHFPYLGDRRFPMQSVFKLPLGAAVLAEVD